VKLFSGNKLPAAAVVMGLITAPSLVSADNSASAYTGDGTAVIGAAAAYAGLADSEGFTKVLTTELKNSGEPKDLVIGLSFETSLFTMTMVQSQKGKKSSSVADAEIEMYVTVDGVPAAPGTVTFDKRKQELWASLGGVMDCYDMDGDLIVSFDECTITDEEIGLILDTKAAHTFNFLAYNIGSGSHVIEAYARLSRNAEVVEGTGASDANASLGKGTLSVWEVHGSVVR
jgi:energy-converting hydrogenase Eha subunit E